MRNAIKRLLSEEFNALLKMNLLVALLCIPVVTMGPALLALKGTLIKILDDRCSLNRISEFWSLFKTKFWYGVVYELVFAVYVLMLLWAQSLARVLEQGGQFLRIWTTAVSILAAMVFAVWGTILAGVRQPLGNSLWNSVLFAAGRLPRVLLSTVVTWGMLCLGYLFYPISILPAAVILVSLTSAVSLGCLWTSYQEDILSQCEK